MSFYRLTNSYSTEEVGGFPQSETIGCGGDAQSIYKVPHGRVPDFDPKIGCFKLTSQALLTDVISSAMICSGFVVSEKVKQLLGGYNIGKHKFINAPIKYSGKIDNNYYWFLYESIDLKSYIDYSNTEFFTMDASEVKIKDVSIKGPDELYEPLKDYPIGSVLLNSGKLFFEDSLPRDFDIMESPVSFYDTYVSERLATALEAKNTSGLILQESSKFSLLDW